MRWILFLTCLTLPAIASADLYTVKKNGVITITSRPGPGAQVLHRVKDSARAAIPHAGDEAEAKPRRRYKMPADQRKRAARWAPYVRNAAQHYGLPEALVWAVMKTESNFYPHVVSHKGAQGLMQMLPGTAKDMGVSDSFDPEQNIYGGARYLRLLANKFDGDLVLTLSAYHAGGGAVNSAGGIPYSRTAEYVRRVLNHYYRYQRDPPVRASQ